MMKWLIYRRNCKMIKHEFTSNTDNRIKTQLMREGEGSIPILLETANELRFEDYMERRIGNRYDIFCW